LKSLYDISQSIVDALENAERHAMDNDGEITEEMAKELDTLHMEKEAKIGNICKYYKSLLAEAEMIKNEEKNLAARRTVSENKAKRLKEYLSSMMSDGEKFSDSVSKVSWRSSKSVKIENEDLVSIRFKEEVRSLKINKLEIKRILNLGKHVSGCSLVSSNNIQIK
jgi:hypothetical protein